MRKTSTALRRLAAAVVASATGSAWGQLERIDWGAQRSALVEKAIVGAGIDDPRVVAAMRATRRHEFVPLAQRRLAYEDMALPIGASQTISPPFVVAYMTQQVEPKPTDRVLEIGTGSGYQAAVLSPLVKDVYTIEIVPSLGKRAARTLDRLGYDNVHCRVGDGYEGWPEAAPFDKILVTCSPESPPAKLVEQLAEGGRMIVPLGERFQQNLCLLRKENGSLVRETLEATLFVPMTGAAERERAVLPDPTRPRVVNGDFDAPAEDPQRPAGWHYLRQATIDPEARPGDAALRFENAEPGLPSQALQGFAIDGRRVSRLRIGFSARGSGIRFGQQPSQLPYVVVTFYDERRTWLGDELIGPLRGTFDWTERTEVVGVPAAAREAGMRIGLLGGVGSLWLDEVRIARDDD